MNSRKSQTGHKSRGRTAFRLDLRRALFAIGGVSGTLALTFFLATQEKPEKHVEAGFGQELRTGSILVMPLVGDSCQQSVFDNDTGAMRQIDSISCEEAIRRSVKIARANSESHLSAISENFRK